MTPSRMAVAGFLGGLPGIGLTALAAHKLKVPVKIEPEIKEQSLKKGFTLMEMVAVLIILILLTGIGWQMTGTLRAVSLQTHRERVLEQIQQVENLAAARGWQWNTQNPAERLKTLQQAFRQELPVNWDADTMAKWLAYSNNGETVVWYVVDRP